MSESTIIKFDGGLTFFGSPSKEHMDKVSNFYNAVANLMFTDHLGKECAVAIRRWYLENNVLHPEDCAPMGMPYSDDPDWAAFGRQIGGEGSRIDHVARAEFAQRMICRALREAAASNPAILSLIAEHSNDDAIYGLDSLLEMTEWTLHRTDLEATQ